MLPAVPLDVDRGEGAYRAPDASSLPACPHVAAALAGFEAPPGKVHTHAGTRAHAAGTCCCAFERVLHQRRLDAARRVVLSVGGALRRVQLAGAHNLLRRVVRREARAALRAWHALAATRAAHARLVRRAYRKAQHFAGRDALRHWAEKAAAARKMRHVATRFAARLVHRAQGQTFDAWSSLLAEKRRRGLVQLKVLTRLRIRTLAKAMQKWAAEWKDEKRHKRLLRRAVLRLQNAALGRAFTGLRDAVRRSLRAKSICSRAVLRVKNMLMARAFRTWHEEASGVAALAAEDMELELAARRRQIAKDTHDACGSGRAGRTPPRGGS